MRARRSSDADADADAFQELIRLRQFRGRALIGHSSEGSGAYIACVQENLRRDLFIVISEHLNLPHGGDAAEGRNTMMKRVAVAAVAASALLAAGQAAEAKGCIKGAIVGGIAGHYAGTRRSRRCRRLCCWACPGQSPSREAAGPLREHRWRGCALPRAPAVTSATDWEAASRPCAAPPDGVGIVGTAMPLQHGLCS